MGYNECNDGRASLVLKWAAARKEHEDTTYTVLFDRAYTMTDEQLQKELDDADRRTK